MPQPAAWATDVASSVATSVNHRSARRPAEAGTARCPGDSPCAEEDSNLHPLSVDQALNLVLRVSDPSYLSYPSYPSNASRTSTNLDAMDAMHDLDVATDVAASGMKDSRSNGIAPVPTSGSTVLTRSRPLTEAPRSPLADQRSDRPARMSPIAASPRLAIPTR